MGVLLRANYGVMKGSVVLYERECPVWTRMHGAEGRAGYKPAFARLCFKY